jgi:hypothetical protein
VDGASLDTFNALAQRKKQMTDRLEADGIATDCRAIPATQGFDDKEGAAGGQAPEPGCPRRKNLLGCSVRRPPATSTRRVSSAAIAYAPSASSPRGRPGIAVAQQMLSSSDRQQPRLNRFELREAIPCFCCWPLSSS